jgi:hypothetical protein
MFTNNETAVKFSQNLAVAGLPPNGAVKSGGQVKRSSGQANNKNQIIKRSNIKVSLEL